MKHNKLLMGLLSTGIVASSIPLLSITSCGCNPSTPTSDWEIDDSLVYKYNAGYIESSESKQGACFVSGFKLDDKFSVSDITAQVTNLQGMAETAVETEIEDLGDNYFSVNIYFTSKSVLITQTATFDIVLKNSAGKTKTFTGFKVYSFDHTIRISYSGERSLVLATLTDGKNYEYMIPYKFYELIGYTESNAQLQVAVKNKEGEVEPTISAEIIWSQVDYAFNVKLKFVDLFEKKPPEVFYLEFTNADYPEWNQRLVFGTKVVSDKTKIFTYKTNETDMTAEITDCICSDLNIVIPDTIEIKQKVYSITRIKTQKAISEIQVESLTLGDNIKEIYNSSIVDCVNLKKITIGKNAKFIKDEYDEAFAGCPSLQTITIDPDNKNMTTAGCNCIITNSGTEQEPAFDHLLKASNSTTVVPNTVKTIGIHGFSYLDSIETVTIPDSVISIGRQVFYNCSSLTTVTFTGTSTITKIPEEAFEACISLTNITIPDSVLQIGVDAFARCITLASINMPQNLEALGSGCFNGCISLSGSITIPASVESIDINPFIGCVSLTNLIVDAGNTTYFSKVDGSETNCILSKVSDTDMHYVFAGLKNSIIPTNSIIRPYAFADCINLTQFDFTNVISISYMAFASCVNLSNIQNLDKVMYIGNHAFERCESLTELNLSNVISLDGFAFWKCISLTKLDFGNNTNITNIPYMCFGSCLSLTTVNLPDSLQTIENNVFSNCQSLKTINLPDSVTEIGNHCFAGCISLENVNISENSNLKVINENAFYKDISLTNITIPASVKTISKEAFSGSALTSAIFKDPNNWKTAEGAVDPETLKDPAKAAEILLKGEALTHAE